MGWARSAELFPDLHPGISSPVSHLLIAFAALAILGSLLQLVLRKRPVGVAVAAIAWLTLGAAAVNGLYLLAATMSIIESHPYSVTPAIGMFLAFVTSIATVITAHIAHHALRR
jgi:hypothetical protein